jgi:hypothetical protein
MPAGQRAGPWGGEVRPTGTRPTGAGHAAHWLRVIPNGVRDQVVLATDRGGAAQIPRRLGMTIGAQDGQDGRRTKDDRRPTTDDRRPTTASKNARAHPLSAFICVHLRFQSVLSRGRRTTDDRRRTTDDRWHEHRDQLYLCPSVSIGGFNPSSPAGGRRCGARG